MDKDGSDNDGQGDVLAVSYLSSSPGVSSPPPEPTAKRRRTEVAEPSSNTDGRFIRIAKLSGATEEFHPVEGELVAGLVCRVACKLRIDRAKCPGLVYKHKCRHGGDAGPRNGKL